AVFRGILAPPPRVCDGRYLPGWEPPQRQDRAPDRLKPLVSAAEGEDMVALVDELLQRLERLPHRQVDRHEAVVGVRADRRGVAVLGLEAPYEAGTLVGKRVNRIELRPEAVHDRRFEGRPKSADVHLRQVETCHGSLHGTSVMTCGLRIALKLRAQCPRAQGSGRA